jgi:hypothetical protein
MLIFFGDFQLSLWASTNARNNTVRLSQRSVFLFMYVGCRMWYTSFRNILRKRYLDAEFETQSIKRTKKQKRNIVSIRAHLPYYERYFYLVLCTWRSFDSYQKIFQPLRLEGHVLAASFRIAQIWCGSDLDKPRAHTHYNLYSTLLW